MSPVPAERTWTSGRLSLWYFFLSVDVPGHHWTLVWSGRRESNPRLLLGRQGSYHYTTPATPSRYSGAPVVRKALGRGLIWNPGSPVPRRPRLMRRGSCRRRALRLVLRPRNRTRRTSGEAEAAGPPGRPPDRRGGEWPAGAVEPRAAPRVAAMRRVGARQVGHVAGPAPIGPPPAASIPACRAVVGVVPGDRQARAGAAWLDARGIPGPGGPPRGSTICAPIIRGPWWRGPGVVHLALWLVRRARRGQRLIGDPAGAKRRARPGEDGEVVVQDVPRLRLVDRALWRRVTVRPHVSREATGLAPDLHAGRPPRPRGPLAVPRPHRCVRGRAFARVPASRARPARRAPR